MNDSKEDMKKAVLILECATKVKKHIKKTIKSADFIEVENQLQYLNELIVRASIFNNELNRVNA